MTEKEIAEDAEQQGAYGDAFNEIAPASRDSEDQPEGGVELPEEPAEADDSPDAQAGESAEQSESGTSEGDENESASEAAQKSANTDADDAQEQVDPAAAGKEEQRLKSWEGRLKKMEAELNSKKQTTPEPTAAAIEKAGEQAALSGNAEMGEAAQEMAEQVEDGSMTAAQAMAKLSEDFGEDFVRMIDMVVSAKAADAGKRAAADKVSEVDGKVKDIISQIQDDTARQHFEKIVDAVPDFDEICKSTEFAAFVEAGDADRKEAAEKGTAKQVIKILKDFKKQAETDAQAKVETTKAKQKVVSQESVDAATGVRSGAISLPAEPTAKDDFEGAWGEAARSK